MTALPIMGLGNDAISACCAPAITGLRDDIIPEYNAANTSYIGTYRHSE